MHVSTAASAASDCAASGRRSRLKRADQLLGEVLRVGGAAAVAERVDAAARS